MRYGRKLTDREYEAAIAELHSRSRSSPSRAEDINLRKQELSLMIDHRLGQEFPVQLRKELWQIHERIEKKRLKLAARFLFRKLSTRARSSQANSLAALMVDEYAKVIGREDAQQFFGLKPGEQPTLPIEN